MKILHYYSYNIGNLTQSCIPDIANIFKNDKTINKIHVYGSYCNFCYLFEFFDYNFFSCRWYENKFIIRLRFNENKVHKLSTPKSSITNNAFLHRKKNRNCMTEFYNVFELQHNEMIWDTMILIWEMSFCFAKKVGIRHLVNTCN